LASHATCRGIDADITPDCYRDAPTLNHALAAEGARVAARIIREHRHDEMLEAIAEWQRSAGPERRYWRGQASWLIREFRRLHRTPERAAFMAAVVRSRA
jgi:hypothetical protein